MASGPKPHATGKVKAGDVTSPAGAGRSVPGGATRTWTVICGLTFGKDPRTYDMAARILNEEGEHGAWFIELLSMERDKTVRPSGHFRRGAPGEAPYSKNHGFYNP